MDKPKPWGNKKTDGCQKRFKNHLTDPRPCKSVTELFEKAKRGLALHLFETHMRAEDERPWARKLKRVIARPKNRFVRKAPTENERDRTTIEIGSTPMQVLRGWLTGETYGGYILREPLRERIRRWMGIESAESDYMDGNLLKWFHRQEQPTALDEYAQTLEKEPGVQEHADRLHRQVTFGREYDSIAKSDDPNMEGLLEVLKRKRVALERPQNRPGEKDETKGHPEVNPLDYPLKVASWIEARNRILDSLHQAGLVGRSEKHRAILTPAHADRLAEFLDRPRTREEYGRFESQGKMGEPWRFDEKLWTRYRTWDPKTKTWHLDGESHWKDRIRRMFKEKFGWRIHGLDTDPKTSKAVIRLSIPLSRLKKKLRETAEKLSEEYAQYAPYREKDGQYWRGRKPIYAGKSEKEMFKPGDKPRLTPEVKYDLKRAMLGGMLALDLSLGGKKTVATRIRTVKGKPHVQMRIQFPGWIKRR